MPNTNPKRDYRAEYQRRIARGLAKGLSRTQARGHPKARETYVRQPRLIPEDRFQLALRALRKGKSMRGAAQEVGVSAERLRNQARRLGLIKRKGKKWVVTPDLPRQMLIYSRGDALTITVSKQRQASKAGRYMSAVGQFIRTNSPKPLKPFVGQVVTDIKRNAHPLETDPNTLYRLTNTGSETFEQVYRVII